MSNKINNLKYQVNVHSLIKILILSSLEPFWCHLKGNKRTFIFIRYLVGKVKKVIRGAGHEKALVFVLNGVEIVVVEDNLRVVTAPIRETLAKLGSLVGPLKKSVQTFFVVQVQLWQHHLPKYGLVWPIRK